MRLAIYAGSFDPVTFGHLDIIARGARLFDQLVIAIGQHPTKKYVFDRADRMQFMKTSTASYPNVEIESFDGLLANYAHQRGAIAILRGLRVSADFEYELPMVHANAVMYPGLETLFLPTAVEYSFVSSSIVREIASYGGDISRYVPEVVIDAFKHKSLQS